MTSLDVFLYLAGGMMLVGGVLVGTAGDVRRSRAWLSLPVTALAAAATGQLVKVRGVARPMGPAFPSPITGRPSAAYVVRAQFRIGTQERWAPVDDRVQELVIVDAAGGQARVRPSRDNWHLTKDLFLEPNLTIVSAPGYRMHGPIDDQRRAWVLARPARGKLWQVEEARVEVEMPLTVIGRAQRDVHGVYFEARDAHGVVLLDGDESHLRARVRLRSRASFVVALIGLGLIAGATVHLLLR